MSNFGDINTGLNIGASQSVRRNASDSDSEAFIAQDLLVSGVNIKTINNIPVVGSGNIEITSSGGGGGEKPIYLTSLTSTTVPAYKQLSYTPETTETTVSATANNNTVTLQTYIFDLPIGVTSIDAGNWSFYVNGFVSNSGGVSNAIVETYKRDTGGTETLLFSVTSPEINNTSYEPLNFPTSTQGVFTVNTTDKIVSKLLFKTTATVDRTFTYKVGDGSASYFTTPLALRHNETRARDASDAHPASSITNTPAGNISSTNVQLAINELDTEKANDTAVVHLTGNETIAGIKTFSSQIVAPTIKLTTGAASGYVLTSSVDGTSSWQASSGGGLSWGASITGTSGTGITSTIGNSASAGTVGYSGVIGNTQTTAVKLMSLDAGSSFWGHTLLELKNIRSNGTGIAITPNATQTATWNGVSITMPTTGSGAGQAHSGIAITQSTLSTGDYPRLLTLNLNSTGTTTGNLLSWGLKINVNATDATGFYMLSGTNVNSLTNGLANITLANTQSGASALLKLDGGTSAQGHKLLYIKSSNASSSASMIKFDQAGGASVVPMEFVNPDASGKYLANISPAYTSGGTTAGAIAGYILVVISGTTQKIPYYSV